MPFKDQLLCFAALSYDYESTKKLLIDEKANHDTKVGDKTLLHILIKRDHKAPCKDGACHFKICQLLLEDKRVPTLMNQLFRNPIMTDTSLLDRFNRSPIHYAVKYGEEEFVRLLANYGVNIPGNGVAISHLDEAHHRCEKLGLDPYTDSIAKLLLSHGAQTSVELCRKLERDRNDWRI